MNKIILTVAMITVVAISSITGYIVLTGMQQKPLPELGTAHNFELVDQDNETVTLDTYLGKVLLIDFIYTNCPDYSFCPLSSLKMEGVQKSLIQRGYSSDDVHLISISFDYKYDGPRQMKAYGVSHEANFSYWSFLSGNKSVINLAKDYEVITIPITEDNNTTSGFLPFVHSLTLTVIDSQGIIRAKHTKNEWTQDEVLNEINSLVNEKNS